MIKSLALTIGLLAAGSAAARTSYTPVTDATAYLGGVVTYPVAVAVADQLLQTTTSRVSLVINSPGGSVYAGMFTINAIEILKARGVTVDCIVSGMAASMAFQILAHCTNRYVLPNSLLLWHPVRVQLMATMTPGAAADLAVGLKQTETMLLEDLLKNFTQIDEEAFFLHYRLESMLTGIEVNALAPKWLTIIDNIVGLKTLDLNLPRQPMTQRTKSIDKFIYICPCVSN